MRRVASDVTIKEREQNQNVQSKQTSHTRTRKMGHVPAVGIIFLTLCIAMSRCQNDGPPTLYLREVFIGRCSLLAPRCDCENLWNQFYNVTAYKSSNDIAFSDYQPLLDASTKCWSVAEHKFLFWSGSGGLSHDLSRRCDRYCTLEDSLPGYCLNGLQWCAADEPFRPGYNTTFCPPPVWNATAGHWESAKFSFWEAASVNFAQQAKGNVTILLGAIRGLPAYNLQSTFARFEVPHLQADQITSVEVLVIKNTTMDPPEKCGSGSLVTLMDDLRARLGQNAPITCIDDSLHITFLLCAEDPYSPQCSFAAQHDNEPPSFSLFELIMLAVSGFVFGMLASFIAIIVFRSRQAEKELDQRPDGYMVVPMPSDADDLIE